MRPYLCTNYSHKPLLKAYRANVVLSAGNIVSQSSCPSGADGPLDPCSWKCWYHQQQSSAWELFRNAYCQAPPQTYWILCSLKLEKHWVRTFGHWTVDCGLLCLLLGFGFFTCKRKKMSLGSAVPSRCPLGHKTDCYKAAVTWETTASRALLCVWASACVMEWVPSAIEIKHRSRVSIFLLVSVGGWGD